MKSILTQQDVTAASTWMLTAGVWFSLSWTRQDLVVLGTPTEGSVTSPRESPIRTFGHSCLGLCRGRLSAPGGQVPFNFLPQALQHCP